MSQEDNGFRKCKNQDAGCNKMADEPEMKNHEASCSYNIAACPFATCTWNETKRALLQHFSERHSDSVLESLSFHIQATAPNTFKVYQNGEVFYLLAITLQSQDRAITITEVNDEEANVEDFKIRWHAYPEPSKLKTGANPLSSELKHWLSGPMLKVDVIVKGVNTCTKCKGFLEFRSAKCENKHIFCIDCFPKKHYVCWTCSGELTLSTDSNFKTYPNEVFYCFRTSCYFDTNDLSKLKQHESECMFQGNIHRFGYTGSFSIEYSQIPDKDELIRIIYKDSQTYIISMNNDAEDNLHVSATCENMRQPSFLTINMKGRDLSYVDPIPVTKTSSFEKPQYFTIKVYTDTTFTFTIVHLICD